MRRYYVHKRHNGIIYAELIDQKTGRKLSAKSTRTRNHDEALLVIANWLANDIKDKKDSDPRLFELNLTHKSVFINTPGFLDKIQMNQPNFVM